MSAEDRSARRAERARVEACSPDARNATFAAAGMFVAVDCDVREVYARCALESTRVATRDAVQLAAFEDAR